MVIDGVAGVRVCGRVDIEAEYHIRDTDLVCVVTRMSFVW